MPRLDKSDEQRQQDYYHALGIPTDADQRTINLALQNTKQKLELKKIDEEINEEEYVVELKQLQEIELVLNNQEQRAEYDQKLTMARALGLAIELSPDEDNDLSNVKGGVAKEIIKLVLKPELALQDEKDGVVLHSLNAKNFDLSSNLQQLPRELQQLIFDRVKKIEADIAGELKKFAQQLNLNFQQSAGGQFVITNLIKPTVTGQQEELQKNKINLLDKFKDLFNEAAKKYDDQYKLRLSLRPGISVGSRKDDKEELQKASASSSRKAPTPFDSLKTGPKPPTVPPAA